MFVNRNSSVSALGFRAQNGIENELLRRKSFYSDERVNALRELFSSSIAARMLPTTVSSVARRLDQCLAVLGECVRQFRFESNHRLLSRSSGLSRALDDTNSTVQLQEGKQRAQTPVIRSTRHDQTTRQTPAVGKERSPMRSFFR